MREKPRVFLIKDPSKFRSFDSVSFIRRGPTTTRSVLHYLKMKRGMPATSLQVRDMFPKFFRTPVDARRILETLEKRGFAETVYHGAWRITQQGAEAVYLLARRDQEKHVDAFD